LEEQGFTVFAVAPQTLDDVLESIQTVGNITGKEQEASGLVNEMQSKIDGSFMSPGMTQYGLSAGTPGSTT